MKSSVMALQNRYRFLSAQTPVSLRRRFAAGLLLMAGSVAGCGHEAQPVAETVPANLPNDAALRSMIDEALDFTLSGRLLRTDVHAAWQIIHGVLAFGQDFEILHAGERVRALPWVLGGGAMKGWLLRKGDVGVKAVLEAGSKTGQGHEDQWLAYIAQSHLPMDHPVVVGSEKFTVKDIVEQAKHDVYQGKECSWTLAAFSVYLPPDAHWTARDGSEWSIERILAMEAEQDLNESACGGTHRLFGMCLALDRFRKSLPQGASAQLSGGWKAADEKIREAVRLAREYQQPSGAFSVNYFARPSGSPDLAANLGATGHTLEFLCLALPPQELAEPWVTRAATYLCELFQLTRDLDVECGALYHAAHGLALYRQVRFGPRENRLASATSWRAGFRPASGLASAIPWGAGFQPASLDILSYSDP
jgi:hypothetical protein